MPIEIAQSTALMNIQEYQSAGTLLEQHCGSGITFARELIGPNEIEITVQVMSTGDLKTFQDYKAFNIWLSQRQKVS
jgi:hypothetical protein